MGGGTIFGGRKRGEHRKTVKEEAFWRKNRKKWRKEKRNIAANEGEDP